MNRPTEIPENWDMETDVVVIGFGAAGFAASVTAHDLGANVILLEKAPDGAQGGNTRVAGQGYLNLEGADDAHAYLTALCGHFEVPDKMIRVWADEMCKNNDWLLSLGGDPQEHQHQPEGIEFPHLPGAKCVHKFHDGDTYGYGNTWKLFERLTKDREKENRPLRILYKTPGKELIQNGITGEILGVRAEQKGKQLIIKARKGVVLTCGGFENNQEMIRDYLPGMPYCYTTGSPYLEGDGITMGLSVGADLWHMNNFAGPALQLKVPEHPTTFSMQPLHFSKEFPGGMVVVGADGKRFADEKYKTCHGKISRNGVYQPLPTPCPMHMIIDHTLFSAAPLFDTHPRSGWTTVMVRYDWSNDNSVELEKGWIKKADTLSELAKIIDLDGNQLTETVSRWNEMVVRGNDDDFGRSLMMSQFNEGPYYAVQLSPTMLNTQGGPRRNEKAEILRPDGNPIPRLYSSGELGSIYSNLYQGAGNIGECLAFGRIAGRNVVTQHPWQ
ncbi:FAD-binding protein [Alphaproteobacteria bacterium]|nr:FAD-binding protein [Alphaproteobacteria bacterium]